MRDIGQSSIECAVFAAELRPGVLPVALDQYRSSSRTDLERPLTAENPEGFELAVQGGTLHPYKGRGTRYVAAKPRYLGQQILPLEYLARVAQWQVHNLAGLVPFDDAWGDGSDLVRQHVSAHWLHRVARCHDQ